MKISETHRSDWLESLVATKANAGSCRGLGLSSPRPQNRFNLGDKSIESRMPRFFIQKIFLGRRQADVVAVINPRECEPHWDRR